MIVSKSTKYYFRSIAAIGCWGVRFLISFAFVLSLTDNLKAQITPDNTLGNEASIVNPNGNIRGLPGTLIEGGAVRGNNIFQSFSEFNVGNAQRVYFANPTGIENILTRVTGNNPSNILGTLGVNGAANLFFINPNGIFFGNGARLDITGSFFASTANSLVFNNGLRFSATNPEAPPLLTVNLRPGLQYGKDNLGSITNQGNLTVTENLTLAGGNLDLQGQLEAGKDLTLQAEGVVKVRDGSVNPFIGKAGGKLLIQGNQGIDIFALSNINSGFFSQGDMVLRSDNTIGGDGRFNTGGNFRIEKLDGSLGNLYSPHDPIIQATGDVRGASYTGASLHIIAGGEVEIPDFVWIQGADPANGLVGNVTLSDGSAILINGQIEPTLDIRAGTTAIDTTAFNTGVPTSANIRIGTILFADANSNFNTGQINPITGKVLLTNQYQPNSTLRGDIQVSSIFGGSLVALDSRGGVSVNGNITTSPFVTNNAFSINGGDVKILANNDITFGNGATIDSSGLLGGNITLRSGGNISIPGGGLLSLSYATTPGGKGGDINVNSESLDLSDGAQISASTFGRANAGNVTVNSKTIDIDGVNSNNIAAGIVSSVAETGIGKAGGIQITTDNLRVTNGGQIGSSTFGRGNAGNITITANDTVSFSGVANEISSGAFSNVQGKAEGDGGNVNVTAKSLSLTDGGTLTASTFAQGNAGNITVNVKTIDVDGVGSNNVSSSIDIRLAETGIGKAGEIQVTTDNLRVTNGGQIGSSTFGRGNAGNITITANDTVSFSRV
jgi:filamentous hemagglutinin family protein